MGLLEIIKNIVSGLKRFDISKLPTQGFFYPSDFGFRIKKATDEDIISYEYNFDRENILSVIELVKDVVKKNTFFDGDYSFVDLKSVDIVFIFLEIVKFTKNKKLFVNFLNDESGISEEIEFTHDNFKYFNLSKYNENHNSLTCDIDIDGYKFSMPSIGVENSLTQYLMDLSQLPNTEIYNNYSYDFLFFLGKKNSLSSDEIENLIMIFNFDLDESEKLKVKSIINKFIDIVGYNLKHRNLLIDVKSNIDLHNVWK